MVKKALDQGPANFFYKGQIEIFQALQAICPTLLLQFANSYRGLNLLWYHLIKLNSKLQKHYIVSKQFNCIPEQSFKIFKEKNKTQATHNI